MRLLLLLGGLALAQSPTPAPAPGSPGSAAPAVPGTAPDAATPSTPAPDAAGDASLLRGLDLPGSARKLRESGVPEADVRNSLDAMKGAGVSAGDATEVTEEAVADVKEHGPIDNFGAFVQEKLAAGLRGQELAAAIKAEHAARGKGPQGGGRPDHAGPPDGRGPDGEHGRGEHGRGEHGRGGPDGDHGPDGHGGKGGEHGRPGMDERGGPPDGKRGGPDGHGKGEKEKEK